MMMIFGGEKDDNDDLVDVVHEELAGGVPHVGLLVGQRVGGHLPAPEDGDGDCGDHGDDDEADDGYNNCCCYNNDDDDDTNWQEVHCTALHVHIDNRGRTFMKALEMGGNESY